MVFISATALLRPLAVHRPVSQSTPCRLRRLVRAATKPPPPRPFAGQQTRFTGYTLSYSSFRRDCTDRNSPPHPPLRPQSASRSKIRPAPARPAPVPTPLAIDRRSRCVSSGLPKYDRGPPSVRIAHLSSGPFPGRSQRLLTNCTVLQVPPPPIPVPCPTLPRDRPPLPPFPLCPPKQLRARSRPVRPDFHPPTPRPDPAFTKKSQNNDCS